MNNLVSKFLYLLSNCFVSVFVKFLHLFLPLYKICDCKSLGPSCSNVLQVAKHKQKCAFQLLTKRELDMVSYSGVQGRSGQV